MTRKHQTLKPSYYFKCITISFFIYIVLISLDEFSPWNDDPETSYTKNNFIRDALVSSIATSTIILVLLISCVFDTFDKVNKYEHWSILSLAASVTVCSLVSSILNYLKMNFEISLMNNVYSIDNAYYIAVEPLCVVFASSTNDATIHSKKQRIFIISALFSSLFYLICYYFAVHELRSAIIVMYCANILVASSYLCQRKSKCNVLPSSFNVLDEKREELEESATRSYILYLVLFSLLPKLMIFSVCSSMNPDDRIGWNAILRVIEVVGFAYPVSILQIRLLEELNSERKANTTANQVRRIFMRYVFHEMRNPVNSLTLGLNLLKSSSLSSRSVQEVFNAMEDSLNLMTTTMDDVLSLQSIEDRTLKLVQKQFNLRNSIKRACNLHKSVLERRNIGLSVTIDKDVPIVVLGDQYRIEYVLRQMIKLSYEYSYGATNLQLGIKWSDSDKSNKTTSKIVADVTDNGSGVPQAILNTQMQPFLRLRETDLNDYTRAENGLGIALARDLIVTHGGALNVYSRKGESGRIAFDIPLTAVTEGVYSETFFVYERALISTCPSSHCNSFRESLPGYQILNQSNTIETPTFERSNEDVKEPQNQAIERRLEKEAIALIVDDVSCNRKILSLSLRKMLIRSDNAENGAIALEMVKQDLTKYSFILMDQTMPVMDGIEATRLIRDAGYNNLIIGVTGNTLEEDIDKLVSAGADIVIPKPLQPDQIKGLINFMNEYGCESSSSYKLLMDGNKIRRYNPVDTKQLTCNASVRIVDNSDSLQLRNAESIV